MELFCKLDTISRARGTKISLLINYIKKIAVNNQGVKLRLIQAPMRLNFSLWRPNPES